MAGPPPPLPPSVSPTVATSSIATLVATTSIPSTTPSSTLSMSSTSTSSSTTHHAPSNLNLILIVVFSAFGGTILLALLIGAILPYIRRYRQRRGTSMPTKRTTIDEEKEFIHYWPSTTRHPPGGAGDEESNDGHASLLVGTDRSTTAADSDSRRSQRQSHYQLVSESPRVQSSLADPRERREWKEENRISHESEDGEEEEGVYRNYHGVQPLEHHSGHSSTPPLSIRTSYYALVPNGAPPPSTDRFLNERSLTMSPVDMMKEQHDRDNGVAVSRSKTTKTVSTASMYSQDSAPHPAYWGSSGTEVSTPRTGSLVYDGPPTPTLGRRTSEATIVYGRQQNSGGSDVGVSPTVEKLIKERARLTSSQQRLAGAGTPDT